MRVRGEAYALINFWMNMLTLLLAARFGRRPFRPVRCALAALGGAAYAVAAQMGPEWLRSVPAVAAAAAGMAFAAFGRRSLRTAPLVLAAGLTLCGGADWALRRGVPWPAALALCALGTAGAGRAMRKGGAPFEAAWVRIALDGRWVTAPALRDSGNLLSDGITGLPVIAVPSGLLKPLLPPGVDLRDLATLPRGWRLIRVRTATGERTAMCFVPDGVILRRGKRTWRGEAAVMAAPIQGKYALVPESLYAPGALAKEELYADGGCEAVDGAVFRADAAGGAVLHRRSRSSAQAADGGGGKAPGGPPAPGRRHGALHPDREEPAAGSVHRAEI